MFQDEATIFIPTTIILETAWVLRAVYEFKPDAIGAALRQILGLANVQVKQGQQLALALQWYESGLDSDMPPMPDLKICPLSIALRMGIPRIVHQFSNAWSWACSCSCSWGEPASKTLTLPACTVPQFTKTTPLPVVGSYSNSPSSKAAKDR